MALKGWSGRRATSQLVTSFIIGEFIPPPIHAFSNYLLIAGLSRWFSRLRICLQCGRHRVGWGRPPGGGHGGPLQYSCLENPMDRGAWWAIVRPVAKSRTRLSD